MAGARMKSVDLASWNPQCSPPTFLISFVTRLKEDEGGVPSTVAEAHRKQLEDMDDIVRKEQQVHAQGIHIYKHTNTHKHLALVFFERKFG